jgi:hypothetical protein
MKSGTFYLLIFFELSFLESSCIPCLPFQLPGHHLGGWLIPAAGYACGRNRL